MDFVWLLVVVFGFGAALLERWERRNGTRESLGFFAEWRVRQALTALRRQTVPAARISREGHAKEIAAIWIGMGTTRRWRRGARPAAHESRSASPRRHRSGPIP